MPDPEPHRVGVSTQPGPDGSASFAWCSCGWRGIMYLGPDQQGLALMNGQRHVEYPDDEPEVAA